MEENVAGLLGFWGITIGSVFKNTFWQDIYFLVIFSFRFFSLII